MTKRRNTKRGRPAATPPPADLNRVFHLARLAALGRNPWLIYDRIPRAIPWRV